MVKADFGKEQLRSVISWQYILMNVYAFILPLQTVQNVTLNYFD